ncbi:MAG: hypothetical protein IJH38_05875 [Clostridia bacterium]|nr:hypothetical protein [Clostridia bacterium]
MKKILTAVLMLALALSLATAALGEEAMTWADYIAAEIDSEVTVECAVQDHQSWWDGKVTIYAADPNGAYFIYELPCTEEEAAALVPGTWIRVSGFKAEWSGEVEIADVTGFEMLDREPFVAEALDVTELLGDQEALIQNMNRKVAFKGMTVEPSTIEGDETQYAFLYNWDGSGAEGANSDLYFNVSKDGVTYTFTVESYLTGEGSDVYEAVKALNIGDVVDLEGYLYWYNGANPHITAVAAAQ